MTTTTETTLTDRYVYAVTRSLPESQRADIEKELRASIADAIEARIDAGEQPAAAEKAALNDLGDPMRLASEYADRPMWLIGPKYYFDWIRLLKLLFAIVLPIVFAVFFIIGFIQGGVGQAFGGAFSIIFTVGVHLAFWPTLIFALVERHGKPNRSGTRNELPDWSIDLLPELPDLKRRPALSDLIATVIFSLAFIVAIVWQQNNSVFQDGEGRAIPILNPDLWAFWVPYVFAITGASVLFAVVLYASGRWTWTLASVNVLVVLAGAIPAIYLMLTHQVWNLEFFEQFGWGEVVTRLVDPISAGVFAIGSIGGITDGFVRAAKARKR